jgi:hypothetical protein
MAVHRYAHKILAERSRFDRLRGRISWHRNRPVPIHTRNRKQGGTADVYMGLEFLDGLAEKLNGFPRTVTDIRDVTIGGFGPRSAGGLLRRGTPSCRAGESRYSSIERAASRTSLRSPEFALVIRGRDV